MKRNLVFIEITDEGGIFVGTPTPEFDKADEAPEGLYDYVEHESLDEALAAAGDILEGGRE